VTATASSLDLHRIGVKIFAQDPGRVELEKAVPVFHRWIQEHRVPGILVDVADYAHLPESPGVVLVSHEANLALDRTEGPLGLLYTRKTPLEGALPDRLRSVLRSVLEAGVKLEAEPEFAGALSFGAGEILVLSNDRLALPNSEAAFASIRPALESVFGALYGGKPALARDGSDPRRRLAVRVTGAAADLPALLGRLS
jgi:hypothetical protein